MKNEINKSVIKALCKAYTTPDGQHKTFYADDIQGKGEGQIILLHGPPGTGKTLTAGMNTISIVLSIINHIVESVAEFTKRPLLNITAADLGDNPAKVDKKLNQFFSLAASWGAVVLLDEADVYLARRTTNDLSRNSIVSSMKIEILKC
jgi:SpoVK/Ycf46/Vps4 family AAA+-type ATPase